MVDMKTLEKQAKQKLTGKCPISTYIPNGSDLSIRQAQALLKAALKLKIVVQISGTWKEPKLQFLYKK
jgi:hypothetical protein